MFFKLPQSRIVGQQRPQPYFIALPEIAVLIFIVFTCYLGAKRPDII
jgi:hypothetical protein